MPQQMSKLQGESLSHMKSKREESSVRILLNEDTFFIESSILVFTLLGEPHTCLEEKIESFYLEYCGNTSLQVSNLRSL